MRRRLAALPAALLALLLCLAHAQAQEIWSSTDLGSGLAISNAGRTATSSTASDTLGRGVASAASGKKYYEAVTSQATFDLIGFATSSAPTNQILGSGTPANNPSVGVRGLDGIFYGGTGGQGGGTFTAGDRVALAMDIDNALLWWKDLTTSSAWHPSGDPGLGTGGFSTTNLNGSAVFPAYSMSNSGDTVVASFAAADITGTIPTGFSLFGTCARTLALMGVGC
jgi:hypothetical protein